jgi:CHAT domain-containing protein/tetratricopeptide (TPR) repeat protein
LEHAFGYYDAALRVVTERLHPFQWAEIQNNLGVAYGDLTTGDHAVNLERAIGCYERSLHVYGQHKQKFPSMWARVQYNLGNAYRYLPTGDRGANLEHAIACYQAALSIRTPDQFPEDCQATLNNLAGLFFDQGAWDEAAEHYQRSMDVAHGLRLAILIESDRRRILRESTFTFERAVLAGLHAHRNSLALTLAERGKTRNLADHLWRRERKPQNVSPENWRLYQDYLAEAQEAERRLSASLLPSAQDSRHALGPPVSGQEVLEEISGLRRAAGEMEGGFLEADPDYVPFAKPLKMADIAALAGKTSAILADFCVTAEGTYVFLVGPGDLEVAHGQLVELTALTTGVLVSLTNAWLAAYYHWRKTNWFSHLDDACGKFYDLLLAPVHARLKERYPQTRRLVLIPSQGLSLLPLHAAWYTQNGERRYLQDDYEICYAPSCQVLKRCLEREQANQGPAESLFAIQNPDGSLPFADWEVEDTVRYFPPDRRTVLKGQEATGAAVRAAMAHGGEKLLSSHARFDPADVEKSHFALHGDDKLPLTSIASMSLPGAWLVVMSACETGLTDIQDTTDEYHGIPAAFLLAGAHTAVASLWSVDDCATALLMRRLHANLYERRMAKASALNEAQRWLRNLSQEEALQLLLAKREELLSGPRMAAVDLTPALFQLPARGPLPFANPTYWAAFQCIGAGWPVAESRVLCPSTSSLDGHRIW